MSSRENCRAPRRAGNAAFKQSGQLFLAGEMGAGLHRRAGEEQPASGGKERELGGDPDHDVPFLVLVKDQFVPRLVNQR